MKQVLVESKMIKYSKFSEPLLDNIVFLNFNENKVLSITADQKKETYSWKWADKEKLIITIAGKGDFKGSYKIGNNLSSDFLFLSKQRENKKDNMIMLSFIPIDKN